MNNFTSQGEIIFCSRTGCIVENGWFSETGGFCEPYISGDDGIKYLLIEVSFSCLSHLMRQSRPRIVHGKYNAFDVEFPVQMLTHNLDGLKQLSKPCHCIILT